MLKLKPQPKILTIWRFFLVLFACIPAFGVSLVFPLGSKKWTAWSIVWILLFLLVYLVYLPMYYKRVDFIVNKELLTVRRGVIHYKVYSLPIAHIQYATMVENPLDRMFGLASLRVIAPGGSLYMQGLKKTDAQKLADRFSEKDG